MLQNMRVSAVLAVSLLGGCAIFDPPPQEDPMANQVAELERRIEALERSVS